MKKGSNFRERDIINYDWEKGIVEDERRLGKKQIRVWESFKFYFEKIGFFFVGNMDLLKSFK